MNNNNQHGQEATERERSAAEMAALHSAMMEELGIGRKDALPLEDRAANVLIEPSTFTSKRVRPENPASVWHNLNLDDAEPGVEALEDIAGGQLYRLRRGGSGLGNAGRGGHSAGRGRGGASYRGGHASIGGRGNFAAGGRNVDPSRPGQPHFNDAKRSGKSHATVDAGIARLQREAEFGRIQRAEGRSVKVHTPAPKSAKPVLRITSPAVARAVSPAVTRSTTSKFKLAPPSAFLSHNKIGSSPTARVAEPVVIAPQSNTGNGLSEPSKASKLAPQGGLAASRWASFPPTLVDTSEPNNLEQFVAPETPISTLAPCHFSQPVTPIIGMNASESNYSIQSATSVISANNLESNVSTQAATGTAPLTIVTDGVVPHHASVVTSIVVAERNVKASKNNSMFHFGTLRLTKSDEKSPLTIELKVDMNVVFSEVLTDTAILKADANIVTYQAGPEKKQRPFWKFQFQLPGPALSFVNYHTFKLSELRRNGCSSRSSEQEKQTSSPVPSSAISNSSNTTSRTDIAYLTNRISSATFADLSQLNGQETLFSLSEEESPPEDNQPTTYSSFQDLLTLMEGDIVEGTLQVLNANHGGSFFDHVSQLAKGIGLENDADFMKHAKNVFIGGLSSSRYSRSKPILSVTEGLVSDFLSKSDTLQKFPREYIDTYIKEISRKILDKAQNPQNTTPSETVGSTKSSHTAEAGEVTKVPEVVQPVKSIEPVKSTEPVKSAEPAKPTEAIKPVKAVKLSTAIKSTGPSNVPSRQERITYSIEEMKKMRPGARISREVLAAGASLEKYLPSHKPQYKHSHRASARKIQPSEWKTQFASKTSNQLLSQTAQQDETIEEQTSKQTSFASASLSVANSNQIPSEGNDRQETVDKDDGASFSKLSPLEWKVKFNGTPSNLTSSTVTEVKETFNTGKNVSIGNDAFASVSDEQNIGKASAETLHQNMCGNFNGRSFIASQAQNYNVAKGSTTTAKIEVKVKVESESDTSPLVLPTNRGLSTSIYATTEVVNQAAVLRAASGHRPPPPAAVRRQDPFNRSNGSPTSLKLTQVHDTLLWEALLSPKQKSTSIKFESTEAPKNKFQNMTFTSEPEKSMPVTISDQSVLQANPQYASIQPVFKVSIPSNLEKVPEFKAGKQTEDPLAVIDSSTKRIAKAVASRESNPVEVEKTTEKEIIEPKIVDWLCNSRHIATDSEIDRLAHVLSHLDVKTEKQSDVVIDPLPVPARVTSPTIEEILEKKRANGLATSKWASPQATAFNAAPRPPQPSSTRNSQLSSNMPHYNGTLSPRNSHYNPNMAEQSSNGNFLKYGNQCSAFQEQDSNGYFFPGANQQYSVQHMQSQKPLTPVLSTVLVTDPVTGKVQKVTGVLQQTHVPVVAHSPPTYVGQSTSSGTGFITFAPRSTMFDKSFFDSDSEDVLKANAPIFTPSHQRDGSNMTRSALSPVKNHQNAQQEAIQARLNQSLAEKRM